MTPLSDRHPSTYTMQEVMDLVQQLDRLASAQPANRDTLKAAGRLITNLGVTLANVRRAVK